MNDEATISAWLSGVTYRPGWEIRPGGYCDGSQWVIVWATERDVCKPGEDFQTGPLFRVPEEVTTRAAFLDWLMDVAIPGVEQHERWEWFRVDGKHHRDPHAAGMPAFATKF
jgi:hypothetical protein